MAEGYIIGSGGGSALEENTGNSGIPIYIDGEGEAQPIDHLDPSILAGTIKEGKNFNVVGMELSENKLYYSTNVFVNSDNILLGAGWNDFAEYRHCLINSPGTCVIENNTGILEASTKRLQSGANIVSDTYGIIVGDYNNKFSTPIAVAGRVLAKPDNSKFKIGDAVCSGKNGTVSKMSRLEIILFPDKIIGYVSEMPNYKIWNKKIKVNDRIWIKVV